MWKRKLTSSVALSHLVLNICTFNDIAYSHFHHVSLRKKKNKTKEKPFIKKKSASILKEYTLKRLLKVDGGWKGSDPIKYKMCHRKRIFYHDR